MFGYTSLGFGSGGVATTSSSVSAPSNPFFADDQGNGSLSSTRCRYMEIMAGGLGPATNSANYAFQNQPMFIIPTGAKPAPTEFLDFFLVFSATSVPTYSVQYSVILQNNGQGLVSGTVTFSAATSKACTVRFPINVHAQPNDVCSAIIQVVATNSGGSVTYQEAIDLVMQ